MPILCYEPWAKNANPVLCCRLPDCHKKREMATTVNAGGVGGRQLEHGHWGISALEGGGTV